MSFLSGLGRTFTDILGDAGNAVGGLVQGAEQVVPRAVNDVVNLPSELTRGVTQPSNVIPPGVQQQVGQGLNAAEQFPQNPVGSTVKAFAPGLADGLDSSAQLLSNATQNVPVVKTLTKRIISPVITSFGTTVQHAGQLGGGQLPAAYTQGSIPQRLGAVGTDVLNASMLSPEIGAAKDTLEAATEGGGKLLPKVVSSAKVNAAYGAGYGATGAMQQKGATPASVAKSAVEGAVVGGAIGAAVPPAAAFTGAVVRKGADAAQNAARHFAGPKPIDLSAITPPEVDHITAEAKPAVIANPGKVDIAGNGQGQSYLDTTSPMTLTHEDDTGQFLNKRGNIGDLEYRLMQQQGHYDSGNLMTLKLHQEVGRNPADEEAVFHHMTQQEAGLPADPLTENQQRIYEGVQKIQAAQQEAEKARALSNGETFNAQEGPHIQRIVQDKNTKYQQFVEGDRSAPTEGISRKTTDTMKGRTIQAITDENGDRSVVAITQPRDELGKATGSKRIIKWTDGKPEDMGTVKIKTDDQLLQRDLGPTNAKIKTLTKEKRILSATKGRTLASSRRLNNLTQQLDELAKQHDDIVAAHDEGSLKGKVFTDKNGNRYTIGDATDTEVEKNTNVRYFKNATMSAALAHSNTVDAANAVQTANWIKTHPEYSQHFVASEDVDLHGANKGWERPQTRALGDVYADPQTTKILDTYLGSPHTTTLAGKLWRGINNPLIQVIIANPGIHGVNLMTQGLAQSGNAPLFNTDNALLSKIPNGPFAIAKQLAAQTRMASAAYRANVVHDMLQNGVHLDTYGKDVQTAISTALDKAHLPHVNKANATAMAALDLNFRATTFDTDVRSGMSPRDAATQINTFMGKKENIGVAGRNVGLFYHWLLTEKNAMKFQLGHPIQNIGSITNTALMYAAVTYGFNAAYRAITGNPNAHVRFPGELGLIHDIGTTAYDTAQGHFNDAATEAKSVVSSHIMPVASALLDQAFHENLYSGQQLTTAQQKFEDAKNALFAPGQNISKIMQGKMSVPEAIANELGGLYTPHAGGAPAAPNLPFMNTGGAKGAAPETILTPSGPQTINDPTGYKQEQAYYTALNNNITNNSSLSPAAQAAATTFITKYKNAQGQTIENNNAQSQADWAQLMANPTAIPALQKYYQESGSGNPEWNLTGNGVVNGQAVPKMLLYAVYKSLPPTNPQKEVIAQLNPWIGQTETAVANWGANTAFGGNITGGPILPPTVAPIVQDKMNQITQLSAIDEASRTPEQIAQLRALNNDPAVQSAFTALDAYDNQVLKAEDLPEKQFAPTESPELQKFMSAYDAASKTDRATLRTQQPALYNQMQQAMENQDLASVESQGALAEYGGHVGSPFLGDVANLGDYDITSGANPNGTTGYALTDFTGGGGKIGPNGLPTVSSGAAASRTSPSNSSSDALANYFNKLNFKDIGKASYRTKNKSYSLKKVRLATLHPIKPTKPRKVSAQAPYMSRGPMAPKPKVTMSKVA